MLRTAVLPVERTTPVAVSDPVTPSHERVIEQFFLTRDTTTFTSPPGTRRLAVERPRVGALPAGYAKAGAEAGIAKARMAEMARIDFFIVPHW
jgi:hypothetical protein